MITRELLSSVEETLAPLQVEWVIIGLAYTCVALSDGSCGLAATLNEKSDCQAFHRAATLVGSPALDLARGLLSTDPLLSALGLATVNATLVTRLPSQQLPSQSVAPLDALVVSKNDVVGLVGYIGPLIRPLRERAEKLLVFERNPTKRLPGVLPDWATELELPRCDVVFISGTAFINKTIDHLLELSTGRVAVAGPSTPMWPELLHLKGVVGLFGAKVRSPEAALRTIAEGGGTKALFRDGVDKIALISPTLLVATHKSSNDSDVSCSI
jgi:hypothetical protein